MIDRGETIVASTISARQSATSEHIIFLTETERIRVEFGVGQVELGRSNIKLATEQQLVEAVIAALCAAFYLRPDQFETRLVISELPENPKLGAVSLAVKVRDSSELDLDSKAIGDFCTAELVKLMPEVVRVAGVMATTPTAPMRLDAGSTAPMDRAAEEVHDRAEVAREVMAEELLKRVGGKRTLKQISISAGGERYKFDSIIPIPQRTPTKSTICRLVGHVNALNRRPSQVELCAKDQADSGEEAKMLMMYKSGPNGEVPAKLLSLLSQPPSVKIRFRVRRVVEEGMGSVKIKDTLIGWRIQRQSPDHEAWEHDQAAFNHAPPRTSGAISSTARLQSVPTDSESVPAQFAAG